MSVVPALVLRTVGDAPRVESVRVDRPGRDEVLVAISAAGVCQTDLDAVRDARSWPIVLGHEGAGTVVGVGEGVHESRIGEHVIVNWRVACGECVNCNSGRHAFCEDVRATSTPRIHDEKHDLGAFLNAGTFCPLVVVPARGAIRIDPAMPLDLAAMVGCAVATGIGAAIRSADVGMGQTVVVTGTGAVGLSAVMGARLAGAGLIVAADLADERRQLAREVGATHVIDPTVDNPVEIVAQLTNGRGVDHVIEATGTPSVMADALMMTARGGTVTLVGAAPRQEVLAFRPRGFMSRQLRLTGCIYGEIAPARDLPTIVDWYLQGRLPLDSLRRSYRSLEELPGLFGPASRPAGDAGLIRTIVTMEGR